MLFDLKGRRRRVVQVTYATLAALLAVGLVGAGIGSDVSGGLFDAFRGEGGGDAGGASLIEKRVETAQARLRRNPRDEAALKDLTRAEFQLAGQNADPNTGVFRSEAKANLARSASAWERYLALEPEKPDASLARVMVQVYGPGALNRLGKAAQAQEIIAEAKPSPQAYLQLAQYAAMAKDTRTADLAGQKAVDLAPKSQRKAVRAQLDQIKAQAAAPPGAAGGAPSGAGGGG